MGVVAPLLRRVAAAHVNHRRIASGAVTVGLLVLAAKIVNAFREVVIASRFGISETVDAFNLAVTLTTWLPMMIVSISISVLVPRLISLQTNLSRRQAFIRELNATVVTTAVIVLLLTVLVGPPLASWVTQGLDKTARLEASRMTLSLAPLASLTVVAGYLAVRLQAREQFAYSALEALPAGGLVVLVLLLPPDLGPFALIVGTLLGGLLQTALLARMTHHRDSPIGGLSFQHSSQDWESVYTGLIAVALGQLAMGAMIPIDQAVAARLGDGTVATLGYANRLIGLATSLGVVVIGRALLPIFSSIAAARDRRLGQAQATKWAWSCAILGGLAAGLGWLLAPVLVRATFERGEFTSGDTASVVLLLRAGLLQIPFFFGGMVVLQWLAANNEFRAILAISLVGASAKIGALVALGRILDAEGIMISNVAMYATTATLLFLYLGRLKYVDS